MHPTVLENGGNIFDIIMPWVAEKKEEDKKAQSGKKSVSAQKSISSFFKKSDATKAKAAASVTEESKEEVDKDTKLAMLSKVVKSGCVESFDWTYKDRVTKKDGSKVEVERRLENLQAILISPKWAEHGFDTFASTS